MPDSATTDPTLACQIAGTDGAAEWHPTYADSWIGFLQTHRQLTRELDAHLEAEHGLTLSELELLARLNATPERWLRLSALAGQTGLSLSRVSRIVDALEARGFIERRPCETDARAINAYLTAAGAEGLKSAELTHRAAVQSAFFNHLSCSEVETLAAIFARFAPGAAAACQRSD